MLAWCCGKKTLLGVLSFLISCSCCVCYNLDTEFRIVYNGSRGSYFGYTTALHRNRWGSLALVGAPKANTTTFTDPVYQPGALFKCNITEDGIAEECQEVMLMTEGATPTNRIYDFAHKDKKDEMWLGVSLAVRPGRAENDVVTCGHLWKNQYHAGNYLVNGICYVINGDLDSVSVQRLLPLTFREKQMGRGYSGALEYNHAHGQVGISAEFSEDGSNLILGAPGIWSWTGSVVNYRMNPDTGSDFYRNPVVPRPYYEIHFNSYFGYSVTSGKFFQSELELFAVGAPRDDENKGKVYIIGVEGNFMRIQQRIRGLQLGEYFGSSVLAVDLNHDSHSDLLVGAPLNSLESAGDEGKVYVYISNGKDLEGKKELRGDKKSDARFGTALANIGDLDQDGFTDIAVGAPYEDGHGAVYIYHGSKSGVKTPYAQKIIASDVSSELSGFGIHISRGMDIDNNGYPDILVGSYLSSNSVLFRSRPVVRVFPKMAAKQISLNQTDCDKYQNLTCVQIDPCLWYTGKNVPESLEFQLTVTVQDPNRRGFFITDDGKQHRSSARTLKEHLRINEQECLPFQLYLNPDIKDFITPISIQFSHALVPPSGAKPAFYKSFPVYHRDSTTNITSSLTFQTDCEDQCLSDLIVTATQTEPAGSGFLVIGNVSRLAIEITVENRGDPAYLSELLIILPPEITNINQGSCEAGNQQNNASLICNLGNPLRSGTKVEINIKLDITKIPPHTKYLEIVCRAVTYHSRDINPDNDVETVALHLETVFDIGITGVSSQDQILYNGSRESPPIISHTYTVRNHGPSPVKTIGIHLHIPYVFLTPSGEIPFLSITALEGDSGESITIPATCEDTSSIIKNIPNLKHYRKSVTKGIVLDDVENKNLSIALAPENYVEASRDLKKNSDVEATAIHAEVQDGEASKLSSKEGHLVINCETDNVQCIQIRCSATPFTNLRKFAQISVDFQLNFTILDNQLSPWYQIEFVTVGSIMVTNSSKGNTQVKTLIIHEGPPPPPELDAWIIFASAGVGVLLLLIILILLIKVGFFRRKEKDKMKLLQSEGKKAEKTVQPEEDDTETLSQ